MTPVVILCGGRGLRLGRGAGPKPLFRVGGLPLLVHLVRHFVRCGFRDFILCLGYGAALFEHYFGSRCLRSAPARRIRQPRGKEMWVTLPGSPPLRCRMVLARTGQATETGERVRRILPLVQGGTFLVANGDIMTDARMDRLLTFHSRAGVEATVLGVYARSPYGHLESRRSMVTAFLEKPPLPVPINGGVWVFEPSIERYISDGNQCVLEREPMQVLARNGQLAVMRHRGFWHSLETRKDAEYLRRLWAKGQTSWRRSVCGPL